MIDKHPVLDGGSMMVENTLQAVLEADKERVIASLSGLGQAAAVPVVQEEWNRILLSFNDKEEEPLVRAAANDMIQAAKSAAALLDTEGYTRIYGKTEYRASDPGEKNRRHPVRFYLFLMLGLLCMLPALYLCLKYTAGETGEWYINLLSFTPVLSAVFWFLGGRAMPLAPAAPDRNQEDLRAEMHIDPAKTYHAMLSAVLTIDRQLESLRSRLKTEDRADQQERYASADLREMELMGALLEDAYGRLPGDPDASETISRLKYYLHQKRIDVVNYEDLSVDSAERETGGLPQEDRTENLRRLQAAYFDRIPAYAPGTIRPALVMEGRLLKKGLVSSKDPAV